MITLLSLNKIARKVYSFLPLTVRSYIFNLRYAKQSKIKIKLGHHDRKPDWLKWAETANKVAIIPCSFEFDELVNQRPINAAKYFASKGYKVLFIAWQWKKIKNFINLIKRFC